MDVIGKTHLDVTVDKRHIISIGERLYAESVELLRELVNNAYDADATEVQGRDRGRPMISVGDDGTGMDADGLRQYFCIGSDEKVVRSLSPRFGRERIGQFGIGKFASLAAAFRFEVITRRGPYAARVIFDKKNWESSKDVWQLPLEILSPDSIESRRDDGHPLGADQAVRPRGGRGDDQGRRAPPRAGFPASISTAVP